MSQQPPRVCHKQSLLGAASISLACPSRHLLHLPALLMVWLLLLLQPDHGLHQATLGSAAGRRATLAVQPGGALEEGEQAKCTGQPPSVLFEMGSRM